MTAVRNNSENDDGTDTVASGISWFYFNGVQVTNLYVSGNSWIGFGASSEQLKVNRRDAKVYYEYTEAGTIGNMRFFKLRWRGYSAYNQAADAYAQQFDVFLFDNGKIYLNWFKVPTFNFDGTKALVCGSTTTSFTATAGTAGEWTFTPTDVAAGTGWSVATGRPNLVVNHKTSGSSVYTVPGITCMAASSAITWTEDKPAGTSVTVSVSTDGSSYTAVTNGGQFLPPGSYDNATAYIKVKLATTDATVTPTVSSLHFVMQTTEDQYSMILEMEPRQRILNAVGQITVAYDGDGSLVGEGGPVAAFSVSFVPADLVAKNNPHDPEHIEISSVAATGTLTKINYANTAAQDQGHIEIASITATGTLTNVNNI
jgi:hypothetical protein